MLFNPDLEVSSANLQPKTSSNNNNNNTDVRGSSAAVCVQQQTSLRESFGMFSPPSPSPTRSMIKEANDHLQLLHHRVAELEKTVQDQAEALIKKDECMQARLRDLASAKDTQIAELNESLEVCQQRVQKLEHVCQEKDTLIEQLGQRNIDVDELVSYVPALERLLVIFRRLPRHHGSNSSVNHRGVESPLQQQQPTSSHLSSASSKTVSSSSRARKIFKGNGNIGGSKFDKHHQNSVDGLSHHHFSYGAISAGGQQAAAAQTMADLRIGRSFNINSNFSMSEDEDDVDRCS